MKMTQELADIHTKVVGGIYTPPTITVFVADLIREMGWNPDNFQFKKNPHLYIHVKYGDRSTMVCLEGYCYAYQVKLVMDAVAELGYFD
jgi:hypothetical protein